MKEIDTIREALEMALRHHNDLMLTGDLPTGSKKIEQALSALSTIEADLKPQETSEDIDSLIEQLDEVLASESDDANPSHRLVYLDPDKAAALITAHDDVIRRECVAELPTEQEIIWLMRSRGVEGIATVKLAALDISRRIKSAILSTEPARDIKPFSSDEVAVLLHAIDTEPARDES